MPRSTGWASLIAGHLGADRVHRAGLAGLGALLVSQECPGGTLERLGVLADGLRFFEHLPRTLRGRLLSHEIHSTASTPRTLAVRSYAGTRCVATVTGVG